MLDWIFEGAANWVASVMTQIMDAISGLFLEALGTDMTAMEEYFPFAVSAYTVVQYMAWALLFLVVVWQLFRAFEGNRQSHNRFLHHLPGETWDQDGDAGERERRNGPVRGGCL